MNETERDSALNIHSSRHVRAVLIFAGAISTAIGLIGILIPLLPTTPFLLLAAICFARSSDRFYNALMRNRYFGPPLREWHEYHSVSMRNKCWAVAVIIVSFSGTIIFAVSTPLARGILLAMCVGLIAVVLALPSRKRGAEGEGDAPS